METRADAARVLIADAAETGIALAAVLRRAGHRADSVTTAAEALERVLSTEYSMLLADLDLRFDDGPSLLERVKRVQPSLPVVVSSDHLSVTSAIAAFRGGAFDVVEKPACERTLAEVAQRAARARRLGGERRQLSEQLELERTRLNQLKVQLASNDPTKRIIGDSPLLTDFVSTIREVGRTDSTVLLTGESGTGKGLAARTIHELSARAEMPFVEANCTVYAEGVLHSELFGHEKGAFTGASRTKKGRLELARGGTLFLDEIGEISPSTQLLLLRVLQERTFERVGGEETLEADVRLIAATNRDLQEAMRQGAFREDLFYRLHVIPVHVPPLRERPEDIPLLAQHFLTECCSRLGRQIDGFAPEAVEALARYPWPGNVRELENLVERIVVLNRSGVAELRDLPAAVQDARGRREAESASTLRSLERRRIVEALREAAGNKKTAARLLGIHRSSLYAKMRRHGLLDRPRRDEQPRVALRDTRRGGLAALRSRKARR